MANRTQFVIEAVANGAVYELDKLEHREKAVAQGMKEIAKEAQVAEYKLAESARRMQAAIHTQGGAFMAAGRAAAYSVAAAPIAVPVAQHVAAAATGYGVANPATYAGSYGAQYTGRDQGQHTDPYAARLKAEAIAVEVRRVSAARRIAIAQDEARQELAAFERMWKEKEAMQAAGVRMRKMVGAATLGVAAYAGSATIRDMQEAERSVRGFEKEFRKVGTLGSNIDDMSGKRAQVIAYSNAWGVTANEVVKGMYAIESAASNLSKADQRELMTGALQFNRMQGTILEDGGKAILKYKEIYSDTIQSISQAKNRLYKIADLGDLDIDKIARFGPDALARGKSVGYSDTDVGGMIIAATQKLGRTEKTLMSVSDVMQKMPEAAKRLGFAMTGTLKDLEILNRFKPTQLLEAFGTDSGTLKVLMDNQKAVEEYSVKLKGIGPIADEVAAKLKNMWKDKPSRYTELQDIYDTVEENRPKRGSYVNDFGQSDLDWKARRAGYGDSMPSWLKWPAEVMAWVDTAQQSSKVGYVNLLGGLMTPGGGGFFGGLGGGVNDTYKVKGQNIVAEELKAAGRTDIDPFAGLGDPKLGDGQWVAGSVMENPVIQTMLDWNAKGIGDRKQTAAFANMLKGIGDRPDAAAGPASALSGAAANLNAAAGKMNAAADKIAPQRNRNAQRE